MGLEYFIMLLWKAKSMLSRNENEANSVLCLEAFKLILGVLRFATVDDSTEEE